MVIANYCCCCYYNDCCCKGIKKGTYVFGLHVILRCYCRWAGGFMGYSGQPIRIRHVTSGRYLGIASDDSVITVHRNKADEATTTFCLRQSKVINFQNKYTKEITYKTLKNGFGIHIREKHFNSDYL